MKKAVITLAVIISCAIAANAAPFLICDPQAGVETYNLFADGEQVAGGIPVQADGSLRYDLAGMAPGAYTFTVEACNVWGCSEVSDPFVSPGAMQKPVHLNLTP